MSEKFLSRRQKRKKTDPKKIPQKSLTPQRSSLKKKTKRGSGTGVTSENLRSGIKLEGVLLLFILAVLGAIIVIGPFKRGLFFTGELLPVHIICFALFLLWWVTKVLRRDGSFLKTPLDWSIFFLVVFYLLSFFVAVDKRAALGEFLKIANYFIIYLLVADICKEISPEEMKPALFILLHVLLASGVAVAVAGLGAAAGTWDLHGAYVGGRICTPLQYPNTAAAYLTATYFLALSLVSLYKKWYLRPLYLAPSVIVFIAFIFTYSRGAWLLIPVLALLGILVAGRKNRLRLVAYLALSSCIVLPFMLRLDAAFGAGDSGRAWAYIMIAALAAVAGGYLVELFLAFDWKVKLIAAGVAVALLVFFGLQAFLPGLGGPLTLERGLDEPAQDQYFEQRVDKVLGGSPHLLSLDVNAGQEDLPPGEEPEYAWRLLVYGYDLDEERSTLLDHREGPTAGWEKRELEFLPEAGIQRLEVRLYNHFPGTAVAAKDVFLLKDGAKIPLRFTLHRMLPDRVYTRIFSIGAGERSVEGRFAFYGDALKIIRDHPILGTGGGGWGALYFGYQEYSYFTTEVHNHFLQVWVETGTLGFVAFLCAWLFFIVSFLRSYVDPRLSAAHKTYWAAVFVPALAIGAHSALDFNLSLGAVSIFLFALLGAGRSLDAGTGYFKAAWLKKIELPGKPWSTCIAGALIALFLSIYTFTLWGGYKAGVEAVKEMEGGNPHEAAALLREAISKDPYEAANYLNLANIYEQALDFEEDEEKAYLFHEYSLDLTRRAHELEPYNVKYVLDYGSILMRYGFIEEGVSYINKLLELQPHVAANFAQVARARLAAAEHYLGIEEREKAGEHLQAVIEMETELVALHETTAALNFYLGRAYFLLQDDLKAAGYFAEVEEEDENYGETLVYRTAIYEKMGEKEQAEEIKTSFADDATLLELYHNLTGK